MILRTIRQEKATQGARFKTYATFEKEITKEEWLDITDVKWVRYMRALGGREIVSKKGYYKEGYLISGITSISPDGLTRTIRKIYSH